MKAPTITSSYPTKTRPRAAVEALAGLFAERLAWTPAGREIPWHELARFADALAEDFAGDPKARALADLVAQAARLAAIDVDPRRGRPERLDEN